MSPLWSDELRIVLYPGYVSMVRIENSIARQGFRLQVQSSAVVSDVEAVAGEPLWGGALKALGEVLPSLPSRKVRVTVILSNQFMHYALVPWSADLGGEDEEQAMARHCFRNAYGEVAEHWDIRLSPGKAGAPMLASAVDGRLPDALRAVLGQAGVKPKSIQPHLMAAYNTCRGRICGDSAWFVVVERGSLCLALLQRDCWSSLRTMRIGEDWPVELPQILEREEILADCAVSANGIYLWAPEFGAEALPEHSRWQVLNQGPECDRFLALETVS